MLKLSIFLLGLLVLSTATFDISTCNTLPTDSGDETYTSAEVTCMSNCLTSDPCDSACELEIADAIATCLASAVTAS